MVFVVGVIVTVASLACLAIGGVLALAYAATRQSGSARRLAGGRVAFRVRSYVLLHCYGFAGIGVGYWLRGDPEGLALCLLAFVPAWLGSIELHPSRGMVKRRLFGLRTRSIGWSDIDHVVTTWERTGQQRSGHWSRRVVIVGKQPGQQITLDRAYYSGQDELLEELERRREFRVTVTEAPDRDVPGPGSNL